MLFVQNKIVVNLLATKRARGHLNPHANRPSKRQKVNPNDLDLTPVLQGLMQIKHGTPKGQQIRILVDTGASHTVVDASLCRKLRKKTTSSQKFSVPGKGLIQATAMCKVNFQLPQLSPTMTIQQELVVLPNLSPNYDMIMGRDLIRELGLIMDLTTNCIHYEHLSIPMEPASRELAELHFLTNIKEPQATVDAVDRVKQILEAKYAPVSAKNILDNSPHLSQIQKHQLNAVLQKHQSLFNGTLGR